MGNIEPAPGSADDSAVSRKDQELRMRWAVLAIVAVMCVAPMFVAIAQGPSLALTPPITGGGLLLGLIVRRLFPRDPLA